MTDLTDSSSIACEYSFTRVNGETVGIPLEPPLENARRVVARLTSTSTPFSGLQVAVRAERALDFPEETSTADHDETGHVAWQAMPMLCHFILSSEGQALLKGSRVLELGAGIGVPGILAGRTCAELVLTDSNDAVVERLRRNIELNRSDIVCGRDATRVANVLWGADAFPSAATAAPRSMDVVLGSDVVYSASSARTLLETVDFLMADPNGVLVLAYIPRWPSVDRALHDGIENAGLAATAVPLSSFLPSDEATSPDGHALPQGACLLLLRRREDLSRGGYDDSKWIPEPPVSVTVPHSSAMELQISPEHLDGQAAASSLAEAASGSASSVSVCVDATGPFAVTPQRASALREALGVTCCEGKISAIRLIECWLGAEGWTSLAPGLRDRASSLVSFSAEGDEIDAVAAATLGESLAVCARLETVRFARNPLGDAGAEALSRNPAAFAGLISLTLSRCELGDVGAGAVAEEDRDQADHGREHRHELRPYPLGGAIDDRVFETSRIRELAALLRAVVRALDQCAHLFVDDAGGFLAVRLGEAVLSTAVVITAVAYTLIQPVHAHHGIGLFCDLLQVAQRPCGDFAKHDFLRRTTAKRCAHLVKHLLGGGDGAFFGEIPRGAQTLTSRHNAHLHKR